jgi:3-hydroxyacyl-CoA dehydrogenase
MHARNARRVTIGNFDDDLALLTQCDWIIEAVVERLDIKHSLYQRVEQVRRLDAVISSNTSTIPLNKLIEPMPTGFREHFLITHFFNPPRYMRLLELVKGEATKPAVVEGISNFCDLRLGKGVVEAKDTPGFIANRIGTMWLGLAVSVAVEEGVSIEEADAVLGKPFGIPSTGAFGLLDLVGLDLMPHIRASMASLLPADDPAVMLPEPPAFLADLVADGYTGRKGKGGFYRLNRADGGRVKEGLDLSNGQYRASKKARPSCQAALKRGGLAAMFDCDEPVARYAWRVMSQTLLYSVQRIPEVARTLPEIDEAMRLGFRWSRGPFQLIDDIGVDYFCERLEAEGVTVPALLTQAKGKGFYPQVDEGPGYLSLSGESAALAGRSGTLSLTDVKMRTKPTRRNGSASLWDIGEGVFCLEFHTKMNALDTGVVEMIFHTIEIVKQAGRGLVVYNEAENFSVGANAGLILFASNIAMWDFVEMGLSGGQDAYLGLKYAPFPVVGAPSGMALGGGCEILLHCDAVQAHSETYMGLVEVGVGLLPGWGGCKEMVTRWMCNEKRPQGPMPALQKAFEPISLATVSRSAEQARDHLFLLPRDRITMNRDRLLADAQARVLELADDYVPPEPVTLHLPGATARAALSLAVEGFKAVGLASEHDARIAMAVADVITGGDTDITDEVTEQDLLKLERKAFMSLLRTAPTVARLEHMLSTGKPLRN